MLKPDEFDFDFPDEDDEDMDDSWEDDDWDEDSDDLWEDDDFSDDEFELDSDSDAEEMLRAYIRKAAMKEFGIDLDDYEGIEDAIYDNVWDTFDIISASYDTPEEALQDDTFQMFVSEAIYDLTTMEDEAWMTDEEPDEVVDEDVLEPDEDINMFLDNDVAFSRKSYLSDRYNVSFGSDFKQTGHRRKNLLFDNVTNHYDSHHNLEGYSRKSFLSDRYTNYYDKDHNLIGYSRKSFLNDDYTNYYDNKGNYLGSSRKDFLTGQYQRFFKKK